MYEPTQEIIAAELRLRGTAQMADIAHILGPGFAPLIPYEIQRMKATGLIMYDEPLGPDSVLRFPHAEPLVREPMVGSASKHSPPLPRFHHPHISQK